MLKVFIAKHMTLQSIVEEGLTVMIGVYSVALCVSSLLDLFTVVWLWLMLALFLIIRFSTIVETLFPSRAGPSGLVSTYLMPPRDSPATFRMFEFRTRKGTRLDVVMAWDGAAYLHDHERATRPSLDIKTRLRDDVEMEAESPDVKYCWRVKRYYDEQGKLSKHGWTLSVVSKTNGAEIDSLSADGCLYTDNALDTDPRRCSICKVAAYGESHRCGTN